MPAELKQRMQAAAIYARSTFARAALDEGRQRIEELEREVARLRVEARQGDRASTPDLDLIEGRLE
jgi:hypothetical protein